MFIAFVDYLKVTDRLKSGIYDEYHISVEVIKKTVIWAVITFIIFDDYY